MANPFFRFKQFCVRQDKSSMKVTTDACLFGALVADLISAHHFFSEIPEKNMLDVGTGTGLLSLMFAQKNPGWQIDAIEIDNQTALQAKENISQSPWNRQIQIILGDARSYRFEKKYHLVISNPPFYEKEIKSPDPLMNIAKHQDALTLNELILIVNNVLHADGYFFILLPYKRFREATGKFQENRLYPEQVIFIKPAVHKNYFRAVLKCRFMKNKVQQTEIKEIYIQDINGNYSEEFMRLLKDYYLYLS
ncbi:MAG: methyltransferase [Chitinophagaceae bacterium]|nr:methyltransferase [Chitinophagaceae bacterium]